MKDTTHNNILLIEGHSRNRASVNTKLYTSLHIHVLTGIARSDPIFKSPTICFTITNSKGRVKLPLVTISALFTFNHVNAARKPTRFACETIVVNHVRILLDCYIS